MKPDRRPPVKSTYGRGLDGLLMGETAIVEIDGTAGRLAYRGHPIESLADRSFEAVSHLVLWGTLPDAEREEAWRREIAAWRALPPSVLDALAAPGPDADLVHRFRTGVAHAAALDPERHGHVVPPSTPAVGDAELSANALDTGLGVHTLDAERRRVPRILAWTAAIAAAAIRTERGEPLPDPDPDLGYAAHVLYQALGRSCSEEEVRAFEVSLIVQAEHGIHAAALAALTVSSAGSPLDLAVLAGIGALSGSLHGGANRPAYQMVLDAPSPEAARAWARERIAERHRFPGYGHRVYKSRDPRAEILIPHARRLLATRGEDDVFARFEALRETIEDALGPKGILANVDAVTGLIYGPLGLPQAAFTIPFCLAIQVGWMAHALEYHGGPVVEPGAITLREDRAG
jgi:citrate synthase